MKIVSISMVKNEADIIERFIRVNSKVIDEFYILDDGSSDSTVRILEKLRNSEGTSITICPLKDETARNEYRQSECMNWLLKFASNACFEKPEFILPLDADEFIFTPREVLEEKLNKLPEGSVGALKWKTYVPCNGSLTAKDKLNRKFLPVQEEQYQEYKVAIPYALAGKVALTMGNHRVYGIEQMVDLDIELSHFPIRSSKQIIAKALITANKFTMKKNRKKLEGYHITKIADEIRKSNYLLTDAQLEEFSLSYLGKMLPKKYGTSEDFMKFNEDDLKYTPNEINVVSILDNFIMDLVRNAN